MKKILIFTAGFGEGHNTAARNIRDALEQNAAGDVHVEIHDLFDSCYGRLNGWMRKAYLTAINRAPSLWQGIYNYVDKREAGISGPLSMLSRLRQAMEELLLREQPDAVISTYPVYGYLLDEIHAKGRARHYTTFMVVTDSISINSIWHRCSSDFFLVPNEDTAEVFLESGVSVEKVQTLGFPVQLAFSDPSRPVVSPPGVGQDPRILYIINSGKKKAPKIISHLLDRKNWEVTIVVGRDEKLHKQVTKLTSKAGERVTVLGWTDQMPQLLMSHHVVVSKAGGATVQEALAAGCPMVVTQIVPGQEEGNYELIRRSKAGTLAVKPKEIAECLDKAFGRQGRQWAQWKANAEACGNPRSSLDIAKFVLDRSVPESVPVPAAAHPPGAPARPARMLQCDFHTHTTFSDGKLTVSELVDFYGLRGFDVLCVTDHLCDPKRLLGKLSNASGLVIPPGRLDEYFETIEKEKKRAWEKYDLLLMAGIEFNKDGYTKKTSAHLLGIDLEKPIDPSLSIKETIAAIHGQGALAVASHPHEMKSEWGKDTLYFWENQDEYAPLLDAWEIANRDDIFNPIGLKRLPFVANSDFHKPKHIYSWKTLLLCEKEREAVKECVRRNRDIALTLYRDENFGLGLADIKSSQVIPFPVEKRASSSGRARAI